MAFRYKLVHHPSAAEDYRDAVAFFEDLDPDLASIFEEDFQAALRAIASGRPASTLYAVGSSVRWVKLKRFSHKVFFEPESDEVRLVLSVVSGRRHPKVISRILRKRKKPE